MTILESTNHLINWFKSNDYFSINENFKTLFPNRVSESKEADLASINCALIELSKENFVRSYKIKDQDFWILMQPVERLSQQINLSYDSALIISQTAQEISEHFGAKELMVKTNSIVENDILSVIQALLHIIKTQNKTNE